MMDDTRTSDNEAPRTRALGQRSATGDKRGGFGRTAALCFVLRRFARA